MRWTFATILLALLIILEGCSQHEPVSGIGNINALQVDIWASSGCVRAGETVKLRATVTNRGTRTETVRLNDKPVLDVQISYRTMQGLAQDDTTIRWSEGRPLSPDLTELQLKPGESKSIEMDWVAKQPLGVLGTVNVRAIFRYGDAETSVTEAYVAIFVESCPGPLGP